MTDDLIARLRYTQEHGIFDSVDAGMYASSAEAADTLERYKAALEAMQDETIINDVGEEELSFSAQLARETLNGEPS